MVAYMKSTRPVKPIDPKITFPVISIMAEGDLVMVATVSYNDDKENPGKKWTGTHFDLFRIENGKIAEHWDSVEKERGGVEVQPQHAEREEARRRRPSIAEAAESRSAPSRSSAAASPGAPG